MSLFGEKYLEILPPEEPTNSYIKEDSVIAGINSPPLFDVVSGVYDAMQKIQAIIQEGDLKESLGKTIANINAAVIEIKEFVADIKKKKGTVGRLFYDDSIYTKTEEFIDDLKRHPWKLLYKPKDTKRKR